MRGLVLDATRVRDAQFSPLSNDPWPVLRRAYTGPRLIFNLLFLTAFFLPYVARTGYWVGVNRTELAAARALADLRNYAAGLRGEHAGPAAVLERPLESIANRLPGPESPGSRSSRVWRLVIGADRGTWFWVSALLLLVYNVLRALLTMFVAPMRDEEERSGITPAYRVTALRDRLRHERVERQRPQRVRLKRERLERERQERNAERAEQKPPQPAPIPQPREGAGQALRRSPRVLWWAAYSRWTEAYGWLIWPHRVASALFWLAVASFTWNAWHWLMLEVWLPAAFVGPQLDDVARCAASAAVPHTAARDAEGACRDGRFHTAA